MSTMHPTGDGGGGPTSTTSTDDNMTPVTPSTEIVGLPGSHHHHHPPPSPLSGCYLLVVLPEPHTAQHRDLILNRLAKGFLSWDKDSCHVDLEKELQALVAQAPEGEEARNGERLIQYATENLVTEVLIHPQTNTLLQCVRNLLASFTKHRHIIHAGYTFSGNGSWILQDGTFSLADFLDAFSEHDVQRVLRAYENSVTVDINCAGVGEWSTARLSKEACTRSCRVRLNPDDVLTAGVPAITSFTNYVGQYLVSQTLDQLMEPSDVVGNIRFSHPTLYVFPGGQGDAALFGINGFNMLVDGGFARKACFWDFARHLDRLDAVLITRINNSNVGGMSSILRKKKEMQVYPQIGHFFSNLIERKHSNSPDGDKDLDPLILNLTDIGQEMMVDLRKINLRAHPCYRDPSPINLYHKVGHGTLDMYVLSPSKDSREVREFLTKWHASDSKLFSGSYRKDSNNLTFPIQNLASICALIVWQPANPEDTITRILFPGSTPQHKIFEGIERLKHLEFLKHPVCTAKSLSPSTSILALKDRSTMKQKLGLIEETKKSSEIKRDKRDLPESKLSKGGEELGSKTISQASPIIPIPKAQPAKIEVKTKKAMDNKKLETESKKIEKGLKEMKKESMKKDFSKIEKDSDTKKLEGYRIKMDNEKTTLTKESKVKSEPGRKEIKESKPHKVQKTELLSKPYAKIPDKKPKPLAEKKDSVKASPTPTPKKSTSASVPKVDLAKTAPRPITKPTSKQIASIMPAKSAKDANNRKVVEQKNIEIASAAIATAPAIAKLPAKQKAAERKPIGRRTKAVSPKKGRVPLSPSKSTRSTPTTSVKSDNDGVISKVKGDRGTTDSSTVSTPSGIEIDSMAKLADKSLTEKSEDMSIDSIESKVLADLKEEREVVEEIEAVLQKAERIEGARGEDHLDGDDDVTAEATDKKEEDMTEDDVTADIEELPKKEISRKTSHELTEEDEYLIIEKEEIYIEDSIQSGEGEQKHLLDAVESETAKTIKDEGTAKDEEEEGEEEEEEEEEGEAALEEEAEVSEGKEKTDVPEKRLDFEEGNLKEMEPDKITPGHKELLEEQVKDIIISAAELVQKAEDKDDSGKKDSEDITKEPSSLSPDKFDSSEKKTTDTDIKPGVDQKDQQVPEKLEESHERMSTLESGATTTAPTLPEDERIPLDEIKEVINEKYLADQEQVKNRTAQANEPSIAPIPTEPKPDAKPFEVHPALHGIQREIVKTPDEVADLPVHEEVDPTLYRIEDFEKTKEEKPSQVTVQQQPQQQETKEPETPQIKEQKGVFSFFGKVADKFEKGIDKLTGKSRRDSEKDIDEKSSSKSSSPKEIKSQNISFPDDVGVEEISPVFAKVGQISRVPEAFEESEPEISKVKMAAIKDTAKFLQDEITDLQKISHSGKEWKKDEDTLTHKLEAEEDIKTVSVLEPALGKSILTDDKYQLENVTKELGIEEDAEEVEALLEEASKKFKTVKDSLRDSLESLEEKIAEEEMVRVELAAVSKDVVKDTLSEVVEKLEDIKPHEEDDTLETREPEKLKFDVPEDDENEIPEDLATATKDFKEAVRDVGEVLAGSAGILIEEKQKDVLEIVKKVAEVLKKDDFLSHDVLFDENDTKGEEETTDNGATSKRQMKIEEIILPKKVGITEELPPQEEIGEMLEGQMSPSLMSYKIGGDLKILEDPCVKVIKAKGAEVTSPVTDPAVRKTELMEICADLMQDAPVSSERKRSVCEDQTSPDVMEAGIEEVCIEQKLEHPMSVGVDKSHDMDEPNIVFDRKVSPATAEVVMVTPDLSPASPKFLKDAINTKEIETALEITEKSSELPNDLKNALLHNEEPLSKVIEDLVFTRKKKITWKIIEYLIVIRKIPREKVMNIIEELIIQKSVPRESVVADLDLLRPDAVSIEQRREIERYIDEEFIMKKKKITMKIVEQISLEKLCNKRIIIEIIEEIIIKKKIPRDEILDISEEEFSELDSYRKDSSTEQDEVVEPSKMDDTEDGEVRETILPTAGQYSEIENWFVTEIISTGKKITPQAIDDICVTKLVPRCIFIKIIEELVVKRNIPRSSVFDISEKELSEILASEKEHDVDEVITESDNKLLEITNYISDEFITKNRKITPQIFKDISARNDVSRQKIVEIIEKIVVERKMRRSSIFDISDDELAELLTVEEEEIESVSTAAASGEKLVVVESDKIESVTPERSEIENSIVEEYILKGKRITPYIFEDICIRHKVPRRIILTIIEEIVMKRNVKRNTIIDISDTELSELLTVVEAEGEEGDEVNVASIPKQSHVYDDVGEDKLVDGFVSIQTEDEVSTKNVRTMESGEHSRKESEKDVVDDFEAVEQEYKIHGVPITSDKQSTLNVETTKSDEKITGDIEEAIEDDVSDVVEATEKTSEIVPMVVAAISTEIDRSSEIIDKPDRLNLIPDKQASEISGAIQSPIKDYPEVKEDLVMKELIDDSATHDGLKVEMNLEETKVVAEEVREIEETIVPQIDTETVKDITRPKIMEIDEEHSESKHKIPITDDIIDIPRAKRDSHDVTEQTKDALTIECLDEVESKIEQSSPEYNDSLKDISTTDETTPSSSTVRRMVVTASSEDGGQETEVCPTGSIIYTPEDSLKSSPVKTTPDQDSLRLDKESLHSGISTPEKDSISDKSTTGTKSGDKMTPQDSLDRSPFDTRDSQDLEDSLDKSDRSKLKEMETAKADIEDQEDTISTSMDLQPKIASTESVTPKIADNRLSQETQPLDQRKLSSTFGDDRKEFTELAQGPDGQIGGPKLATQSDEYDSKDQHDRSTRFSVSHEKVTASHHDSKSISPSTTDHDDEDATEIGKSPSVECIDSEASKLPSSHVRKDMDQSEFKTADDHREPDDTKLEKSKSPSVASEKHDEEETQDHSRSPSFTATEYNDPKEFDHESRSSSLVSEKVVDVTSTDRPELDGICGDEFSVKETVKLIEKSESPSVVCETLDEKEEITNGYRTDQSRSPSIIGGKHEGFEDMKLETPKSASITTGKLDEKELLDGSLSPSSRSEHQYEAHFKEPVGKSRSLSPVSDEGETARAQSPKDPIDSSKSSGMIIDYDSERNKIEQLDKSKSPSINDEEHEVEVLLQRSRTSSIVVEKEDEKKLIDRSRSSSIDVEKPVGKDPIPVDRPQSTSIAAEKEDEKDLIDRSKSPSMPADQQHEKGPIERSRLPSIVSVTQDGKELLDRSRSSSISIEKQDEKVLGHDSTSPNIAVEKEVEIESIDPSSSPSISAEKQDQMKPTDRSSSPSTPAKEQGIRELISRLPSTDAKQQVADTPIDRSRSPSIAGEKRDEKGLLDRSRSPSISTEKQDEKVLRDGSRSPSISTEKLDEKVLRHGSRSPSIAVEKEVEIESIDHSRSPSISAEKQDQMKPTDRSRSPSIAAKERGIEELVFRSPSIGAKQQVVDEPIDRSRSSSIAAEKQDGKGLLDQSRSSSISTEKQEERELDDGSKSPSIAGEKQDGKGLLDQSRPPSISTEKQDGKGLLDQSRSSSISTEKHEERELDDGSKSPSIAGEKQDGKGLLDQSRSPSISTEKQDEKVLGDDSRSPSIAVEKEVEMEPLDSSRSSSISAEEQDQMKPTDRSRSPSTAAKEQHIEEPITGSKSPSTDAKQQFVDELIDRSRSPSIAGEKKAGKEAIDGSRPSNVVSEKQDEPEPADYSRSSSVTAEDQDRKILTDHAGSPSTSTEKGVEKEPADRSRSSSIVTDTQNEKLSINRSRSLSIAAENQGGKEPIDGSRSPSITAKEEDEHGSFDHSRSPSIGAEKPDGKEPIDRSRSSSITPEKQDREELVDHPKSPLIAAEKEDEPERSDQSQSSSIAVEKLGGKEQTDGSRSSSITPEKQDKEELVDHTKSPLIAAEKEDEPERSDQSQSSSIAVEKLGGKEQTDGSRSSSITPEKQDKEELVDHTKSPLIAAEKEDEPERSDQSQSSSIAVEKLGGKEQTDGSRSSSITPEKQDKEELVDHTKSPLIAAEKEDEPERSDQSQSSSIAAEKLGGKEQTDRSRSSSITPEKQDKEELVDHTKSPLIAAEKEDEPERSDQSQSSSIAAEKLGGKEQTDRSRSSSITPEKQDKEELVDHTKSPLIAAEKEDEPERSDQSQSSSIAAEKLGGKEQTDRSRSSSITPEKQDKEELVDHTKSPLVAAEKEDELEPFDQSQSSSIAAEKLGGKEQTDRSRSSSITPEKQDKEELVDHTKSPLIAADKVDEPERSDQSQSSSIAVEKLGGKEQTDRSRSSSITPEKQDKGELVDHTKSPLVAAEKEDELEPFDQSRSSSIAAEKLGGEEPIDRSRSSSITPEKQDKEEPIDHPTSPSLADEKEDEHEPFDRSPSIDTEKLGGKESIDRSRSSSITVKKRHEEKPVDHPSSPSIVAEKDDEHKSFEQSRSTSIGSEESGGKVPIDRWRSSSITVEKRDEEKPVDHPSSPSIAAEREDEPEPFDQSRSSSIAADKFGGKEPIDRSRSSSISPEKQDKEEPFDHPTSPNIVSEKQDKEEPVDHPKSPSIAAEEEDEHKPSDRSPSIIAEKLDGKEPIDQSRSSSITIEKRDEEKPVDHLTSPSIVAEKEDEPKSFDQSRSPSIVSEKSGGKVPIDQSRSSSITSEKQDKEEPFDHPTSPNIVSEKQDKDEPVDHPKSPSIAAEEEDEHKRSDRSPSIIAEKLGGKEPIDRSRSSSITVEKRDEEKPVDHPSSPSIVAEKEDEHKSFEQSRSTSIAADKLGGNEPIDRSRSSSITLEKQDDEEPIDHPTSPTIVSEKQDKEEPVDHPKSPSIAAEEEDEHKPSDRSPSIIAEKLDGKEPIDQSRSSSITIEKRDEEKPVDHLTSPSIVAEKEDEPKSFDQSRSPSIVSEKSGGKVPIDQSRSSSITSEKQDDEKPIDHPTSPNIFSEKQDKEEPVDHPKSPSIAAEKEDENKLLDRSPSIVAEELGGKEPIDRSRSSSITIEKRDEDKPVDHPSSPSIVAEKEDEHKSFEQSRSPSIVSEKSGEKVPIDRSRSSSIAPEKQDEEKPIEHPTSPSTVSEKQHKEEPTSHPRSSSITGEKQDGKEAIDHSKSPSITDGKLAEKEPISRSRSPSIATEKVDEKELFDRSRSPSFAAEEQEGKETFDRSRSSSISAKKSEETTLLDHSRSPSIPAGKHGEEESIDHSRSPSISVEKQNEKEPIDRSTSSSVVAEKSSEKEPINRSRSSSIAAEKSDKQEPSELSTPSSIAPAEQDIEEPIESSKSLSTAVATHDHNKPADGPKSPGMTTEERDAPAMIDCSRSPSIVVEQQDGRELADQLSSSSIIAEEKSFDQTRSDEKEPISQSRSPTIVDEKLDDKEPICRSRSPSIAVEKQDEKESTTRSRSSSIAVETQDEIETRDRSRSSSINTDITDENKLNVRSVSPNVRSSDTTEALGKIRTLSISSIKTDDPTDPSGSASTVETVIVKSSGRSRTDSLASEQDDEKHHEHELSDHSGSLSGPTDKLTKVDGTQPSNSYKMPDDKLSSPSSTSDKYLGTLVDSMMVQEKFSPSGTHSEKVDDNDLDVEPRSLSQSGDKPDDVAHRDLEKLPCIAGDGHTKYDTVTPLEKTKPPTVASEGPIEKISLDRSRSSSIEHTDKDESPTKGKLQSIPTERHDEHEPIDLSKSSAIVDDKVSDDDKSRSTSIVGAHGIDEQSYNASVHDSQLDQQTAVHALQKLADTIADNSSATKCGSKILLDEITQQSTPKDRSRSHSLFDADEKTPLGRSRTASLFEAKVPEVTSTSEKLGCNYIDNESDQVAITKDETSIKSNMKSVPEGQKESQSDSKKSSVSEFEDTKSKQSCMAIEEDITVQLADAHTAADDIARVNEYIANRYIMKKEKITSPIIDEIVTLYSMPRNVILELIEDIIVEKNVPRDVIVDFPRDNETYVSAVASKDVHDELIDIPAANRLDIETYIHEELTNNKKISSKMIDELAALKSISRHIIIIIIKEMIINRKLLRPDLIDEGILDESTADVVQSAPMEEKCTESESLTSHHSTLLDDRRIEEDNLPATCTKSEPDSLTETDSTISEQKRVEIETYVMEECVKKGRKITILVLEQIMTMMAVPRSVLLDIIENIIVTRKMSRKGMVDDAIYDDVEPVTSKSPEYIPTKDRLVEFSGTSTPDLKSSGYSTPEVRQYEDKFGKEMSSYSTDYESPFHKAFVGGMTEIRTTHITTLSGKSTPDYSVRGETPESLSENMRSSSQMKFEEKFIDDKSTAPHTSGQTASETCEQAASIFTTQVSMVTSTTTISTTVDSPIAHSEISVPSKTGTSRETFADDHSKMVTKDIEKAKEEHQLGDIPSTMKVISHKVYDEVEPEITTKIIRTEIITEEEPIIERKIIRKEIIEEEPEIITKVIRRTMIDQSDEVPKDYEVRTISRSSEERSPEIVEVITVRTTEITEDIPQSGGSKIQTMPEKIMLVSESMDVPKDYSAREQISADIERTITTVTTLTELDGKICTHKTMQKTTDTLEDADVLGKVMDDSSITIEDIGGIATRDPMNNLKTERITTETIKTVTLAPGTPTPGTQTICDSDTSIAHSTPHDEKSESLGKTHTEKILLEKLDHPISPIIKDLISGQRRYSGESSPDTSLSKDPPAVSSAVKLTSDIPISPLTRDSTTGHAHLSGRSTPDKRPTSRSSTATPEGLRSNEVIRTTITTTRTMSEEGDIITTTMEITETTNEKGETTILEEKTDVKVEDRILPTDIGEGTFNSRFDSIKAPADLPSETDADPISPRSDHSSLHSRADTHVWGGSEERHAYSDEEAPGSPLSTTSQVGYSPQSTYHFGERTFDKGSSPKSMEFSEADMSSSFYGELPDVPHRVTTMKMSYVDSSNSQAADISCSPLMDSDFSFKKCTAQKDVAGASTTSEESNGKRCIDDADLDFEKVLIERKEMKRDRNLTSAAEGSDQNGSSSSSSSLMEEKKETQSDAKKDPLASWGTPLGLPSPKPPKKFNLRITTRTNHSTDTSPDLTNFDAINDWGEPLRLPSPAPIADEASNKGAPSTPKKERKQPKKVISENIKNRKRSESPSKNEKKAKDSKSKIQPVYMDLTYVPHHGNSYYTSVEFFKRVRARYYVFSGTEPSREVYDALLDAKKTWEDKDLEVTMIPTYDTDTLGYWVADNEEALAANHIDLSPSASRCTINLQDHETSCSAYRLEF